jgi:hypothetical protein
VAFAAKSLAAQPVPKFVNDFGDCQSSGQPYPIRGAEELVKCGQFATKDVELDRD